MTRPTASSVPVQAGSLSSPLLLAAPPVKTRYATSDI